MLSIYLSFRVLELGYAHRDYVYIKKGVFAFKN